MKSLLIALVCLVSLCAAQMRPGDQERDSDCTLSGGTVTVGGSPCRPDCLREVDRRCRCDMECNTTRRDCPMLRCGLSCPGGFARDPNTNCEICECARREEMPPTTTDMCRLTAEQFFMRTGCRRLCVRRNDDGCLMCNATCNGTSVGDIERPECGEDSDSDSGDNSCPDGRQCVASGPLAPPRCEERVPEGMQCGRTRDPRFFERDDDDNDRVPPQEEQEEESRRRDRTDDDVRTDRLLPGAGDRARTRDIGRTAQLDAQCQTNLRCSMGSSDRRCEPRQNGRCTTARSRNPELECNGDGSFRPLQCNRTTSGFRCVCVNRESGEMMRGSFRMGIRDRSDTNVPDCEAFNTCRMRRNGRMFTVRHGDRVAARVNSTHCGVRECRYGTLGEAQEPRESVNCSQLDTSGRTPRSCTRNGTTIAHGARMRDGDCNMCGCVDGRLRCTQVRECRREGQELSEREQACEDCREQPQRIISSTDGRNFPSRCAAMNCGQRRDDQLVDGPSTNQPQCILNPCRSGFSCVQTGGRSCNRMEGCEADDVRMCVDRNMVTERVPTREGDGSRPSNPADRDGFDGSQDNAVCGSDGRTYQSLTNMTRQAPSNTRVAFSGRCDREECNRGQVCGTDRVVYNSSCDLRSQSPNARVDYEGECMGMGMDRTTDNICTRVRENNRCNHTSDNCGHLVRPTEGCCPVCGGVAVLAVDEEGLDAHVRATGELVDQDELMRRFVQGGTIPANVTRRCEVESTRPTTTMSNIEITFNARDRRMDSEFCNMASKDMVDAINNPTADAPIESSFVLASTDIPVVTEGGAKEMAASLVLVLAASLIALLY